MKKYILISFVAAALTACNNEGVNEEDSDSTTNEADSITEMPAPPQPDSAVTNFLIEAAAGGLAEVETGKTAQAKASHTDVKRFASMMVNDHTGANAQIASLADARKIELPVVPTEEKRKKATELGQQPAKKFDKAYMDMMVKDHETTIGLFERGRSKIKDQEINTFIDNTLPKLQMHLDSAKAIQQKVKQ